MPMYNVIEYSYNYAKTAEKLWKYHKDIPKDNIANFESLKSEAKVTGKTLADGNSKDEIFE